MDLKLEALRGDAERGLRERKLEYACWPERSRSRVVCSESAALAQRIRVTAIHVHHQFSASIAARLLLLSNTLLVCRCRRSSVATDVKDTSFTCEYSAV